MAVITYEYDVVVFIGRFQPFHNGHKVILDKALNLSQYVCVVLGSANEYGTAKNPFSFLERCKMIKSCFNQDESSRIFLFPSIDTENDDVWVKNIKDIVEQFIGSTLHTRTANAKIGLIGHYKDSSSYYLNLFKDWDLIEVENIKGINSTDIRKEFFEHSCIANALIPETIAHYLAHFMNTEAFTAIQSGIK